VSVPSTATSRNVLLSAIDARYRRPLISFFLRRVRDSAEAEDRPATVRHHWPRTDGMTFDYRF